MHRTATFALWAALGLLVRGSAEPAATDRPMPGTDALAFIAEAGAGQDLYVTDVRPSITTRLTRGFSEVDGPVWSPDGALLAFAAKGESAWSIFVVRRDGTGLRRVVAGRSPSWSPDGARIVFAAGQDGDEEIFAVGLDAPQVQRLTTQPGRDFSPLWAPDGRRIAFASARGESSRLQGFAYGSEIYLMEADGSGVRALTGHNACGLANESEGKLNNLGQAAWTPDRRRLLYRADVCKLDCRVCVIDLSDGRVTPLTNERMVRAFALSPDGRSAAYSWSRRIVVADLESGARRELVRDAWGPA